jgi:uncharacterized protein
MRIVITGATGFVGTALTARLLADGHEIVGVSRDPERAAAVLPARCRVVAWDSRAETALADADAVVNLAGAGVADARWTAERKTIVRASRVDATRALVGTLAALPPPRRPRALLSASAVGYYGDTGDVAVAETAPAGSDFLAEVCREWEHEAAAAERLGVRTVMLRIGVVLDRGGGALERMLPLFRCGLGGRLGSGRQWMSWIHRHDLVALIAFALARDDVRGPVNAVAPAPVTNAELTATLAACLGRPAIVPVPAAALRLALGEMAGMLLTGQRVRPAVAERLGFAYRHRDLGSALADVCRDPARVLEMEQWVPRPVSEVFAFFSDPRNLERITPSFLGFRILDVSTSTLQSGTRIDYRLSLHGLPIRWQSLIRDWSPNRSFVDVQTRGPYRRWEHTHTFEPQDGGTVIRDHVVYELPLGGLGQLVGGPLVDRDLTRIFSYRRATIRELLG